MPISLVQMPPHSDGNNHKWSERLVGIIAFSVFVTFVVVLIITCLCSPASPYFSICSISALVLNGSDSQVTATWDVGFSVAKKGPLRSIYYDPIHAVVFHGQKNVSSFTLGPFEQHGYNTASVIEARFAAMTLMFDAWVADSTVVNGTCGVAYIDFEMRGKVRWKWPPMRDTMQVRCGKVQLMVCSNRSMTIIPSGCLAQTVLANKYQQALIIEEATILLSLIIYVILFLYLSSYNGQRRAH